MISYYFFLMLLFIYLHKYVYYYGEKILINYINPNELNLTDYKIKYVVKNIWKSCILFFILIFGTLYSSLDISGLIFVRGLPTATVIHHCVVGILGSLNLLVDYSISGYYRSIIIYTYFSIIPFLVNFYLGYRYISTNRDRIKKIASYSYKIYTFSLVTNILCQIIFFIYQEYSNYIFVYIALYALILYDDIKLIKFLRKESL